MILRAALLLSLVAILPVAGFSDEIVIDQRVHSKVSIGGFDCSKCPNQISNAISILTDESSGNLTAGTLWQFFDSKGVDSLEFMTICLDVDPSQDSGFGLDSVELKIQDPENYGLFITDVSLGENSIVVPGHEISLFKPEAKLEIALGYDFMERFSADSTEVIQFDFSSNGDKAFNPVFSIEAKSGFLTAGQSWFLLGGFVCFWILVFVVLNRFTKHAVDQPAVDQPAVVQSQSKPSHGKHAIPA